jgi:hypothetical protein
MNSITTVAPPRKYLRIFITPQLACIYCKKLSPIANAERDGSGWATTPVCAIHGYADREGKLGFSLHDEHNSIRRFVIESLDLRIEPLTMLVRRCPLSKVKPLGYKAIDPLEVFADQRTVEACHIDDMAWRVRWPSSRDVFVVWSYDLISFSLWPSAEVGE